MMCNVRDDRFFYRRNRYNRQNRQSRFAEIAKKHAILGKIGRLTAMRKNWVKVLRRHVQSEVVGH